MSELFMRAYYHTFQPTGELCADRILSAVARAGKSAHHTADWYDEWHNIQNAANATAEEVKNLRQRLAEAEELKADFKKAMKLFEDTGLDNLLWELLDTITKGE